MTTSRRIFLMTAAAAGAALTTQFAVADAPAMVAETDPQAVGLGYKADTTKVDAKKYPNHAATQACGNCALYQGKPADAAGACPLFAGKQVSAKAWCSAYAKKAG